MIRSIIDNCLKLEITQILVVQNVFQPIEPFLESISYVTNARFLHAYCIPLFLVFGVRRYVNVMIAAITSHISIILLKWIFAEDRPYWWVNETSAYTAYTRPILRQTYLTCETSAGNPSGHVMFIASVAFVAMQDTLNTMQWYRRANAPIKYFTWNIFVVILAMVTISRMYFACHYLHQCFLGAAFGVTVAQYSQRLIRRSLIRMEQIMAVGVGAAVTLMTIVVYFGHFIVSVDPQWSIRKAFNWCKDPFFIKPETTPIYALIREFGLMFGLIACSPLVKRFSIQMDFKWSIPAVVAAIVTNVLINEYIPRWNGALPFYCFTFVANFAFVVALLSIVPVIAAKKTTKRD